MRQRLDFIITWGAIACFIIIIIWSHFSPAQQSTPDLVLGNPSQAIASLSAPNNYLLVKPEYALSYNNGEGTPNWVEWN